MKGIRKSGTEDHSSRGRGPRNFSVGIRSDTAPAALHALTFFLSMLHVHREVSTTKPVLGPLRLR